ncbi:CHAT domain-containing protein [Calothrix rhizosoleniae]|uniref:CHAT domain-containing protein n=1 Tax=Calothrix rhizosoleniae TaxID=888997 RepID=UPI000B49BE51|nr:CHAT domain-containing protein [Calothrix rhizosoleniae]
MLRIIRFHLFIFLNFSFWLALASLAALLDAELVKAQITPAAPNDTNTQITTNGNLIDVNGGRVSGVNLFHSFDQFNVGQDQTVDFEVTNRSIQNILNRVNGGDPSIINGVIESPVNFYLMNPAGIIFGSGATLDVNGNFTATTANGIRFGSNNWFSASGDNNYTALTGNPDAFGFTMSQPGGIDIRGDLTVSEGNLNLIAGTVINTGQLSGNQVNIATVSGNTLVTLTEPGSLLSLEIQLFPASLSQPNTWSLPILSLPQLLTAGNGNNANRFTNNGDGTITLSGSGVTVINGDVAVGNIDTSISSNGNSVIVDASGNITTGFIKAGSNNSNKNGDVSIISRQGSINIQGIENGSNNSIFANSIEINTPGTLNVAGSLNARNDRAQPAGNITIGNQLVPTSITVGTISTRNLDGGDGGKIDIRTSGSFNAQSAFSRNTGNSVNPVSSDDVVSIASEADVNGGEISIIADGGITTAAGIASNSRFSGDGGKITLTSNSSVIKIGGSLSSFGSNDNGGAIAITHSGGPNNVPFKVGDASENGIQGNIDAGVNSRITAGYGGIPEEFPVLPNGGNANNTPNGITITSVNSPPTLTTDFKLVTTENQSTEFTFEDLKTSLSDVDGDNTFVQIDEVITGRLTRNGEVVTSGTRLFPGDKLEYTPPNNIGGKINAFIISGSDGVSSTPKTVEVTAVSQEDTQNIQQLPVEPPKFIDNQLPSISIDSVLSDVDNKFAAAYESYFNFSKRERVSLVQAREILLKIQKEAGVNPAIIYASFNPIELNIASKQNKQNKQIRTFNRLDLVLVTANGEAIRKTINTANKEQIIDTAKAFYRAVLKPNNNKFLPHSQQLYKWMVLPLEQELKTRGINNLLFITDEKLRSIPLAALHDGKQFLVEKYSVGFTPSLSLTDTTYKDIRNAQVLAMGMSEFKDDDPLPAVPQEVNTIAGGVWKGKNFLNKDFTFDKLKSIHKSQPFGILHLATHGYFRKGSPDNHFIKLWNQNLKLTEFRQLDLNNPSVVELLVLSACRTALGEKGAELGFGGLAVKTGAKTALGSLWNVDDSATLGLMVEFYQQLRKVSTKSEALRQAQIAMLKGEIKVENGPLRTSTRGVPLPPKVVENLSKDKITNFTHPYYWSAFTMIGNPW